MNIATKILKANDHDNTTLDRVVSMDAYQEHLPTKIINDPIKNKTIYLYEDGSKLIRINDNEWDVK